LKHIKSIRLLFLALPLVVAGIAGPINGQGQKSSLPPLIAQLKLSEGQKKKLEPMYAELDQKVKATLEDRSLSIEAKRAKINELNQSTIKTLSEVLTSKQMDKLKELRQKQPAQK